MQTFAVMLEKVPDHQLSKEIISRHIEYLVKLDKNGQLVLGGPFTDYNGGMIILKARDKDEAISIAQSDPFVLEGARTFEVRTWQLANAENNYLG